LPKDGPIPPTSLHGPSGDAHIKPALEKLISNGICNCNVRARPARSEALLELRELYVAREALVKDRTAAKNRGKVLTLSLLKRHNAQRLEQIDRQIATVEAAILGIVEADVGLSDRCAILTSIPGVSNITAFALLIEMPELGALEACQAASLVGLAPIARQSGRWTGRAFVRGGRASLRQALYMPALVPLVSILI
jgi:transposase